MLIKIAILLMETSEKKFGFLFLFGTKINSEKCIFFSVSGILYKIKIFNSVSSNQLLSGTKPLSKKNRCFTKFNYDPQLVILFCLKYGYTSYLYNEVRCQKYIDFEEKDLNYLNSLLAKYKVVLRKVLKNL